MKGLLIFILFLVCTRSFVSAQDIHLSQFYASDHLLNPAKVGDFEGDFRVTGNYRNQWRQVQPGSAPITTSIISFDKAFNYFSHEIDAGILVAHDAFSPYGYSSDKILLTGGYAKNFNGHNIRGGIQTGFVFRKSDLSKQTFPSQWDYSSGAFNQGWDNMENNGYNNGALMYFDFNMGFQWTKQFGKFLPKAGLAFNHINRPKDTYFASAIERLRMRKVIHIEVDYFLSNKLTIQPKILSMFTAKANDFIIGSNVKYATGNNLFTHVYGGIFYRDGFATNQDALYPVLGCVYKEFNLGLSYDYNVSLLSENVDRKGTFEVSLIYTAPSSKPKYITIPCDRY